MRRWLLAGLVLLAGTWPLAATSAPVTCPQIPIDDDGDPNDAVYVFEAWQHGMPGCSPITVTTITGDYPDWEYVCSTGACNDIEKDRDGAGGKGDGKETSEPETTGPRRRNYRGLDKKKHPDEMHSFPRVPGKPPIETEGPPRIRFIEFTAPDNPARTVRAKVFSYVIKNRRPLPGHDKKRVYVAWEVTHVPQGQTASRVGMVRKTEEDENGRATAYAVDDLENDGIRNVPPILVLVKAEPSAPE